VDNLKLYLSSRNPNRAELFGHRFFRMSTSKKDPRSMFTAGGPGIVLSRAALVKMVQEAFTKSEDCMPDGIGM